MPVLIGEVVTEVVVAGESGPAVGDVAGGLSDEATERIVRMVTERVLERLRREWER